MTAEDTLEAQGADLLEQGMALWQQGHRSEALEATRLAVERFQELAQANTAKSHQFGAARQAHVDARNLRAAEHALIEADGVSTEWFRHQGPARALVADLVHEARRLSPPLRRLARSAGVDG